MRILVVDDDMLDRLAVRRSLREAGINATIDEAESCAEAIRLIRPGSHECIFLDYHMPGDDSADLLKFVLSAASDIPVVIFTGRGDEEVAVEFMKKGAVDYLPKASLTPERLAASLRHAREIARRAAERRLTEQALHEREAEFRTLANVIPQMAWMADAQGRRYWYNERWYEFTGLRPDESLGLGWHLTHHPDTRSEVIDSQSANFEQGVAWEQTVRLRRRDGVYRWFLARAMPISSANGEIQGWVGTDTDITQQKEHELDRERLLLLERTARAKAERAIKARDDMLAIVAHDLRTPLQTIALSSSIVADAHNDDERRRRAGLIERSTAEMQRLISDLLDIAGIESGTFSVVRQPIDIRQSIAEALERFEPSAAAAGIVLTCDVAADLPPLDADGDRLTQVLSNLLDNAIKFTPAGGAVTIRVAAADTEAHITVEDSGKGIPLEYQTHIFDRFWQADRKSRTSAGLGLAISKGIVEAHGGRIGVKSAPGEGTAIDLTLPLHGHSDL